MQSRALLEGQSLEGKYMLEHGPCIHAQEDIGKCDSECKTIQRAAEDIISDHDTDIAEKLWKVVVQLHHGILCRLHSLCASKSTPMGHCLTVGGF